MPSTAVAKIARARWLVLGCCLVTAGAALGFTLLDDDQGQAEASWELLVPRINAEALDSAEALDLHDEVEQATESPSLPAARIADRTTDRLSELDLEDRAVLNAVDIDPARPGIEIDAPRGLVIVNVNGFDDQVAARVANRFAAEYGALWQLRLERALAEAKEVLRHRFPADASEPDPTAEEEHSIRLEAALRVASHGSFAQPISTAHPGPGTSISPEVRNTVAGGLIGAALAICLVLGWEGLGRRFDPSAR